jgi:hypothetical protein
LRWLWDAHKGANLRRGDPTTCINIDSQYWWINGAMEKETKLQRFGCKQITRI